MTIDIKRRRLLQSGAIAGLGALPGMSVMRSAQAATTPTTLIAINLEGGNDTLNTIIPYTNPLYYSLRGGLAIPATDSLPLDGQNALHPSLVGLKALWDANRVNIVHGVGYPGFDFSHFQARQIYSTGDPLRTWRMGWLGRAADYMISQNPSFDALGCCTVGGGMGLSGQRFVPVYLPYDPVQFYLGARVDAVGTAQTQLMRLPPTTTNPVMNRVLQGSEATTRARAKVLATSANPWSLAYPAEGFAYNLRMAVQLMRTDPDVRIIALTQAGFDTHVNQLPMHKTRLQILDAALKAFTDDLDRTGLTSRVLILLYSDFSRRVIPNAQAGTDHGAAQAMILIGPGVQPGIYGSAPPLTPASLISNGNLPMQVDFRSVYSTVLSGWLGIPAREAMGGITWPTLPLLL